MTVLTRPEVGSVPRRLFPWFGASRAPVAVGILGFLVSFAFSWVPSVWFDEAATISATHRSWPELWRMLGNVDAVHGLYYAGMRVWFDLLGYSPVTLRLPSALAVGLAGALLVLLVRRLAPARVAVISGLVFVVLPRITWAGTEGRSYALTALFAVTLTLVFLSAWRRGGAARVTRVLWWTAYGLFAALACTGFLYLVFLVAAHGVTAVWSLLSLGTSVRVSLWGWTIAAAASALVIGPLAVQVSGQSAQVDWIAPIDSTTLHAVFVTQWFLASPILAVVGWLLILVATFGLWRHRGTPSAAQPGHHMHSGPSHRPRMRELPRSTGAGPSGGGVVPSTASVVFPWLIVPTLGLILASVVVSPLYSPRYLTFAAPAAAILMALAIGSLRRRSLAVVAIALCVLLALPQYLHQRTPEAKQKSSWSQVAAFIAAKRAADPSPQAIVYGPVRQHRTATTRVIAYSYPQAFAGLVDVKLNTPAAETGELWETRYPLDSVTGRLDGVSVVWLVTSDRQDWRPSVTRKLGELGYSADGEWAFTGVNVLRYEL